MGLYLRQNENRSELQKRLASELREKAKQKAGSDGAKSYDGVDDSAYLRDMKTGDRTTGIWIAVAGIAVIAGIIYFVLR